VPATLVFYETAPRLGDSLAAFGELMPGRELSVARELTKKFEECRTGTAAEIADHYAAHPPKGEIVLMVGPPVAKAAPGEADVDALLRAALADAKPSQAAASVARETGLDRKQLYARALELQGR
jgi:16S rRNA (cytidine1402-2'-O)-methyltransferase